MQLFAAVLADISSGAIVGEQARRQDQRRNPSAAEATPALVQDSADEEPSAEEMRRARLLRFGLASLSLPVGACLARGY